MCDKIDEKLRWMWMCKQNLCDKMRMLNSGTISKEQSVKKGNRQWSHGSCISFQMRFAYAFNGRAAAFCPVFNYLFICCYVTALNRLLHSTEMSFNAGSMLCITCSIEIHLQWCDESIKFCVMTIISEMRPITQGENRMAINQLQKKWLRLLPELKIIGTHNRLRKSSQSSVQCYQTNDFWTNMRFNH